MPARPKGLLTELARNRTAYLMFLPVAVYFVVFHYMPIGGIVLAFKDFNYRQGIFGSPWNGFKNFAFFFASGKAWAVTRNTLLYNLGFLAAYTFFSMLTAVLVAEMGAASVRKVAQSFMFLPYFISWVVGAALVYSFFNYEHGLINSLLRAVGWEPLNVYSTPAYWYIILPAAYVWKWVGFGSVLYLAAIMGIDQRVLRGRDHRRGQRLSADHADHRAQPAADHDRS